MCVVLECFSSTTYIIALLLVNVIKASGCDVPDWMLDTKKTSKCLSGTHVLVSSSSSMYCQECQEETVEKALNLSKYDRAKKHRCV